MFIITTHNYFKGVMAFFGGAIAKSRSLDDIVAAVEGDEGTKNRNPALREAGRSNTYEDRTATGAEAFMRGGEDEELLMEFEPEEEQFEDDVPEDLERDQGLLREIRRSLKGMSTSLMRSSGGGHTGSLTSISSGRSMASNASVQSDSGLRGQQQQRQRGRKRPSAAAAGRSSASTSKVNNRDWLKNFI